jgi:hypothetical protein
MKDKIFEMYKSIKVGKNEICNICNAEGNMEIPLSIYFVGDKFHLQNDTILFVGKTAVGGEDIGPIVEDTFTDATDFGKLSIDLEEAWSKRRAFYSYTNEVIKRYYGSYEDGKQYIALTNIVKCNNCSTKDQTTYKTKEHCINELKVFWKEVEILKPKKIIFYTGRDYDDFINSGEFKCEEIYLNDKQNCWWHGKFIFNQSYSCEFLRIYHPDYMRYIGGNAKEEYISKVVAWLQQTKK